MERKAAIWQRRNVDELAGRRAAYYKSKEQLEEELEADEDNPDDKDIYDTGDNVSAPFYWIVRRFYYDINTYVD